MINFQKSLDINKEEITDKDKIPPSSTKFEPYFPNITTAFNNNPLTEKEFKDSFFPTETNKSPGYDTLHMNVIRSMYHELTIPRMNIFLFKNFRIYYV